MALFIELLLMGVGLAMDAFSVSLANVDGLQDIYMISSIPVLAIFIKLVSSTPFLGGSKIIESIFCNLTSFSNSLFTSPFINSIFF